MPDEPTPTPAPADPPETPEPTTPPADPPEPAGGEPLGEGGKRALEAERSSRKALEAEKKALQKQLDELQTAQMSDHEKAIAEARKAGETDATAKVQRRVFAAEAKVAASGKLQNPALLSDPDVALKLLGFAEMPVDATGDIDSEAISKAIEQLVEAEPYLAASNGGARPSPGSADGGARGSSTGPTQLTRDDLKSMSPREIDKAKKDGQLRDLLSGKT